MLLGGCLIGLLAGLGGQYLIDGWLARTTGSPVHYSPAWQLDAAHAGDRARDLPHSLADRRRADQRDPAPRGVLDGMSETIWEAKR